MLVPFHALPWPETALAPVISQETIQYHYHKHHKGYVDKLNAMVEKDSNLQGKSLEELIYEGGKHYNLAAQVFNHSFYWESLTPDITTPGDKTSILLDGRSLGDLRQEFIKVAMANFGSGWTWFCNLNGRLEFVNTNDAVTPIDDNILAVIDVWEHAYYIDYRNDRAKYLDEVWNLINWDFIEGNISE